MISPFSTAVLTPHSGSETCPQLPNLQCEICSVNSGKQLLSSESGTPPNPTSPNPGVSATIPPQVSDIRRALTVVCRPTPPLRDSSPVRNSSLGSIALSIEDLPTPEGPIRVETPLQSSFSSRLIPSPLCALTEMTRYPIPW